MGLYNNILKGIRLNLNKLGESEYRIPFLYEKYLKHVDDKTYHSYKIDGTHTVYFKNPKSFLQSTKEIFSQNTYKFSSSSQSPFIIDCGAYIGTSILYFKKLFPSCKVIGFEPDTDNYKILDKNINNWRFKDVKILNEAIWISNGFVDFQSNGDMTGHVTENKKTEKTISRIKSTRLLDLLEQKIDFLKIDIEGAEYDVLIDCKDNLVNVENLFIEYHSRFSEEHKLIEILEILHKSNFKFYIKEAANIYFEPFIKKMTENNFDIQLNIFAFRND